MGQKGVQSGANVGVPLENRAFRGCFTHCVDEKGRVNIPAPFRQALLDLSEDALVLTNYICDGARCLDGYTRTAWAEFEAKLAERSRFDPRIQKIENYYLARAAVCAIDSSGRINIPQQLRTYAGLEKEIVFTSTLSGFRIWDSRVWELIFQESETALLSDPELFKDLDR